MMPTPCRTALDLRIDLLRLTIRNAGGHGHRLRPITARAAAILAERLHARRTARSPAPAGAVALVAAPVRVDLARMSNDAAAHAIASAWLAALTPGPRGDRADVRQWTSA